MSDPNELRDREDQELRDAYLDAIQDPDADGELAREVREIRDAGLIADVPFD